MKQYPEREAFVQFLTTRETFSREDVRQWWEATDPSGVCFGSVWVWLKKNHIVRANDTAFNCDAMWRVKVE